MLQPKETVQSSDSSPARMPARIIRFVLTVTLILAILHIYIGSRLLPSLPIGAAGWVVGIVLLVVSALLIPVGMLARFLPLPQTLADRLIWAGSLVMGLFSSVLVLTFLRDIALLILFLPIAANPFVADSAMLVPALAVLVTLIGFVNARRVPRVVDVSIAVDGLPPSLSGFTIVQISDIHIGPTIKGDYVQAVVERVNQLDADLIAVTGDLVDGSVPQLASHVAPLAKLASRHGSYVVTGNHEYYSGATEWVAEYRRLGLHVLMNEHVVLEHAGGRLVIAGVTDYSAHQFDPQQRSDPAAAVAGSPAGVPRILLAHQPRSADAASAAGFDLQLSGHTHGGQFWPWNLFVRLQQPYTAGLHRHDKLWVYTSRGTGYWGPPKRFGAPSEITRIRLVPSLVPSRVPSPVSA
jgi:predicted MPP superfamily phosphohydrolase